MSLELPGFLTFSLSLSLSLLSSFILCTRVSNSTSFLPLTGSGELEFEEFCSLAAKFLIEEDEEALKAELREAFRIYDKGGACGSIL